MLDLDGRTAADRDNKPSMIAHPHRAGQRCEAGQDPVPQFRAFSLSADQG
jgi:hypothetical protein